MANNTEKELLLLLHTKVDKIVDKCNEIEIVQSKHEVTLQEHIRRTTLAEERIDLIEVEVKPILQGLSFLKVVAKVVATISSLLYAASKFFR